MAQGLSRKIPNRAERMRTLGGIVIGAPPPVPGVGTAFTLEDGATALTLEDGATALVFEDA